MRSRRGARRGTEALGARERDVDQEAERQRDLARDVLVALVGARVPGAGQPCRRVERVREEVLQVALEERAPRGPVLGRDGVEQGLLEREDRRRGREHGQLRAGDHVEAPRDERGAPRAQVVERALLPRAEDRVELRHDLAAQRRLARARQRHDDRDVVPPRGRIAVAGQTQHETRHRRAAQLARQVRAADLERVTVGAFAAQREARLGAAAVDDGQHARAVHAPADAELRGERGVGREGLLGLLARTRAQAQTSGGHRLQLRPAVRAAPPGDTPGTATRGRGLVLEIPVAHRRPVDAGFRRRAGRGACPADGSAGEAAAG